MQTRTPPEKFLVAFSLAGEARELVRSIAEAVERQLGPDTVFSTTSGSNTGLAAPAAARAGPCWPQTPSARCWPMADHSGARGAFGELLTAGAGWRYLPIRGASEAGKSHITRPSSCAGRSL